MKHVIIAVLLVLSHVHLFAQERPAATKYGVVIATINEPKLMPCLRSEQSNSSISGFTWMSAIKDYVSKVITIENYSEEKKYQVQDTYRYDMEKRVDADNTLISDEEGKHRIISVKLLVYSTYKEASIMRNME